MSKLKIACHLDNTTGFGRMNSEIIREFLKRMEVSIHVISTEGRNNIPQDLEKYMSGAQADSALLIHVPSMIPLPERHVRYSMWESTCLKPHWKANLEQAEAVCCPNEMNAISWLAAGVRVPVIKVPLFTPPGWCVNGEEPVQHDDKTFTFISGGRNWHNADRKGFALLFDAFEEVSQTYPFPTLEIKVGRDCQIPATSNPNVKILRDHLDDAALRQWMRKAQTFVCTSHSGGWEFMPLQAMACGLELITSSFSGMGEYADPLCARIVPHGLQPAAEPYGGHWGCIDKDTLVHTMLRSMMCYAREAPSRRLAAMYKARQFTVKRTVDELETVLRRYNIIA